MVRKFVGATRLNVGSRAPSTEGSGATYKMEIKERFLVVVQFLLNG